ncbi:FAD-binding protein, partial [Escherichia coli]
MNTLPEHSCDVLIIGSGAAGLSLALRLADQHQVIVLSRYCYGLQVFSWSGFPDCRHARHSAVRRCFFHPFRDFYAATRL